ncbi:hypothetical protein [Deinococcus hopiensis]|uniref:Uncharacterized protein n=1 Tax=Deinococcus hopiensis KR-140 TaxID=695939 RepID=A0A1W1VM18_9DEIO|nr:hypothetical protein [Deinococcus hopiensis]SMB94333.1 hypothetical protein SAMN00790413_02344 [Deinococcus hopiensis KR-140]
MSGVRAVHAGLLVALPHLTKRRLYATGAGGSKGSGLPEVALGCPKLIGMRPEDAAHRRVARVRSALIRPELLRGEGASR